MLGGNTPAHPCTIALAKERKRGLFSTRGQDRRTFRYVSFSSCPLWLCFRVQLPREDNACVLPQPWFACNFLAPATVGGARARGGGRNPFTLTLAKEREREREAKGGSNPCTIALAKERGLGLQQASKQAREIPPRIGAERLLRTFGFAGKEEREIERTCCSW